MSHPRVDKRLELLRDLFRRSPEQTGIGKLGGNRGDRLVQLRPRVALGLEIDDPAKFIAERMFESQPLPNRRGNQQTEEPDSTMFQHLLCFGVTRSNYNVR